MNAKGLKPGKLGSCWPDAAIGHYVREMEYYMLVSLNPIPNAHQLIICIKLIALTLVILRYFYVYILNIFTYFILSQTPSRQYRTKDRSKHES